MLMRLHTFWKKSDLLSTSLSALGLKLCAAILNFTLGIVLARILVPADFGRYSIAIAILGLSTSIAGLGLPALVIREIAKLNVLGEWGLLKGVILTTHFWIVGAIITAAAIALIGATAVDISATPTGAIFFTCAAIFPLLSLGQIRSAVLKGLHFVIVADVPELLIRPLLMLVLIALYMLHQPHTTVVDVLRVQLISVVVAFVIGSLLLAKRIPRDVYKAIAVTKTDIWLKESIPFLGITIISLLEGQIGIYMLGGLSNATEAGIFQAAFQVVGLIVIGLVAINTPLQPRLAAAWEIKDKEKIQSLISESAKLGTFVAIVGTLIVFPLSGFIIKLYGGQYTEAATVLRILVFGQLINAAAGSCALLLSATGHQAYVFKALLLALIINISASALLIPTYGAIGAAFAAVCGLLTWNIALAYIAWVKIEINTTIFRRS